MSGRCMLGLVLTALAGAVDAVSFARFGSVYASFMSGNTVQLGLHAAEGQWAPMAVFGALVVLFMAGGFVGSLVLVTAGPWHLPVILAVEAAAIGTGCGFDLLGAGALAAAAPLSFGMGAQNNLVVLVRGANPGTTFVTGTAFRFADAVAQRFLGRDPTGAWRLHLLVWLSFAVGAAVGMGAELFLATRALMPLALLMAVLALGAWLRVATPHHRETRAD